MFAGLSIGDQSQTLPKQRYRFIEYVHKSPLSLITADRLYQQADG